ncbi:hypothetical protein PQ472_04320 [Lacticaseibacillus pabuli]|uniref:YolD-like protein n=1 Tax=Lacticaseibacillus pabuli TaxID=3025672 RepID=A0ABY7WVG8_9LACO|nr:hypothetical protein [Lacticaseibacillus sp. KACC 23028]WDF83468.1 hypothetical protein PQ472_04320 [Lacticaseibacillus sp. KACC 23028]
MLDDRLLGMTFKLPRTGKTGSIVLYGITYHYELATAHSTGTTVEIVKVTPLTLYAVTAAEKLEW